MKRYLADLYNPESKLSKHTKLKLNPKLSENELLRCRCRRARCLRLNCSCFKQGQYCNEFCICNGCLNNSNHEAERNFVISKTKEIRPSAFESKAFKDENGPVINRSGCKCKSGCKNRHCICYKQNMNCSNLCKCGKCRNSYVEVSNELVKKLHQKEKRRRFKLIIPLPKSQVAAGLDDKDHSEMKQDIIKFVKLK